VYVFDGEKADDIAEKLLEGQPCLFLGPLIWNLRPGTFEAFADYGARQIYLYSGRVYLPDSHHRHQRVLKAVRAWRDAPRSYPRFSGDRQFKIELYFLSKEGEGNYFFVKNQLPKPTALSKAYDLTTLDDLSLLAKKVAAASNALRDNVNRVTDRLKASNPQVVTLSTLREMMKVFAPDGEVDSAEIDGLAKVAAGFYDNLAKVRPEVGHLGSSERRKVRKLLLVDSATMMHGYAALMRDFNDAIGSRGLASARADWLRRLGHLAATKQYRMAGWSGDFLEKRNPPLAASGDREAKQGREEPHSA
jgi:DndB-like DNA-sulfur modification-associated protein